MIRKIVLFLLNNRLVNNVLIVLRKDSFIKKYQANWSRVKIDPGKTMQENVGFSHAPDIQVAIDQVHRELQDFASQIACNSVLDIGCGPGLYLVDFPAGVLKSGTDLSADFLKEAAKIVPGGTFYCGNFLELEISEKYDLIFSISVLEYVEPSSTDRFFAKIAAHLKPGGYLFLQYPHALKRKDLWYPDLAYVHYSPKYIETRVKNYFIIEKHYHLLDKRAASFKYDPVRYDTAMEKSFRNGLILVAKKHD